MAKQKPIKFEDIKTREELLTRVVDGQLTLGNKRKYVRQFLKEEPFPGSEKIWVSGSIPSMFGTWDQYYYI